MRPWPTALSQLPKGGFPGQTTYIWETTPFTRSRGFDHNNPEWRKLEVTWDGKIWRRLKHSYESDVFDPETENDFGPVCP